MYFINVSFDQLK